MPTIWHKDRWWAGDLVPPFGTPAVWALPLGIYCEDRETFAALRRTAWENDPEMTYGIDGQALISGVPIFVATPDQAALLRALPARSPEEALAERQAEADAFVAKVDRLLSFMMPNLRPARHPPPVANRGERRAAAAKARRHA